MAKGGRQVLLISSVDVKKKIGEEEGSFLNLGVYRLLAFFFPVVICVRKRRIFIAFDPQKKTDNWFLRHFFHEIEKCQENNEGKAESHSFLSPFLERFTGGKVTTCSKKGLAH